LACFAALWQMAGRSDPRAATQDDHRSDSARSLARERAHYGRVLAAWSASPLSSLPVLPDEPARRRHLPGVRPADGRRAGRPRPPHAREGHRLQRVWTAHDPTPTGTHLPAEARRHLPAGARGGLPGGDHRDGDKSEAAVTELEAIQRRSCITNRSPSPSATRSPLVPPPSPPAAPSVILLGIHCFHAFPPGTSSSTHRQQPRQAQPPACTASR
jgi:hypothetical protein